MNEVEVRNSTGRHTMAIGEVIGETKTLIKVRIDKSYVSRIIEGEVLNVKKETDKNYILRYVA